LTPPTSGFKVNFVYAPKQRLYETLTTPAPGGITVPAVAVNITNISRDVNRVFNKVNGFNVPYNLSETPSEILKKIPQPVPVNITVNMTIVTKYQSDMDQIITNFVPYCDPYIIISWKLPGLRPSQVPFEIRSEILWSGNIGVSYPLELQGNQSFRISADTSFTIKGWLFKKMDETVKKIYTIQSDYFSSDNPTTDSNLLTYLN
jgi:T4-like virus Myoviridae tail sheath stabiliser